MSVQSLGLADPRRSRDAYARAVALDPDNSKGLLWHGRLQMQAGNLQLAEAAYRRLIAVVSGAKPRRAYWARLRLGDIAVARGDLGAARAWYIEAQEIADSLATSDLGDAARQHDLPVSFNKVGNVQVAQGDLAGALKSYQDDLAITGRLAKSDPSNAN